MPAPGKDRLSPPLMHVFRVANAARDARKPLDLRDEDGERILAGRRHTGRLPITQAALRAEVLHDLHQLFNTIALGSVVDLKDHPDVAQSILNYGLPDIVHRSLEEHGVEDIAKEIETAIRNFEPRVVATSVHVTRDQSIDKHELKLRFVIAADLLGDPVDLPVNFVADVELETGRIALKRR